MGDLLTRDASAVRLPLVLLHGLGRTRWSLWPVAREAKRRGHPVLNVGYPSRRADLHTLAALVASRIDARYPTGPLDFVTHSMGGIVLRVAVADGLLSADRIARVVMLAPPNRGSELAELLRTRWTFRAFTGPAGQQLGTGEGSVPRALPPVPFELGVIAGSRRIVPVGDSIFPGPNDGKVAVVAAQVEGMADFLVVERPHTFMMWAPEVLAATFRFLETGRLAPPRAAP